MLEPTILFAAALAAMTAKAVLPEVAKDLGKKIREAFISKKDVASNAKPDAEEVEVPQPAGTSPGAGTFTRKLTAQELRHKKEHHDRRERYIKLIVGIACLFGLLLFRRQNINCSRGNEKRI